MPRPRRIPVPGNMLSLVGAVITTASALLFLLVFFLDIFGIHTNPYLGIVFFLILPAFFVFGLLLIPLGTWRERRRQRAGKGGPPHWPVLDLNNVRQRTLTGWIAALTLVNIVVISLAAYSGVDYMDSVQFCGQVCHTVMAPQYMAYRDGPHARVACVQCHIGSGASWFVRSKISGTRQVLAVTFGTYERPIPMPVQNLRPARETCEQCHWPQKFSGDLVKTIRHYADDETNTMSATTLRVHVGGANAAIGLATGIHWHVSSAITINYITTDDKRQVIPWVRVTDQNGTVTDFVAQGTTQADLAKGELRQMDCVDCHNQPAHSFDATPDEAVDRMMSLGEIPPALPFVKREATAALKASYATQSAALDGIASRLREFYRTQYATLYSTKRQDVERAVVGTQRLYERNVFPAMNVTFGTYYNNLGHMDFPGCFRCHDGNHTSKDGKTIPQDCTLCHDIQ